MNQEEINEEFNLGFDNYYRGGGTNDFDQLINRPKYNNKVMTSETNIPEVKNIKLYDEAGDNIDGAMTQRTTTFKLNELDKYKLKKTLDLSQEYQAKPTIYDLEQEYGEFGQFAIWTRGQQPSEYCVFVFLGLATRNGRTVYIWAKLLEGIR